MSKSGISRNSTIIINSEIKKEISAVNGIVYNNTTGVSKLGGTLIENTYINGDSTGTYDFTIGNNIHTGTSGNRIKNFIVKLKEKVLWGVEEAGLFHYFKWGTNGLEINGEVTGVRSYIYNLAEILNIRHYTFSNNGYEIKASENEFFIETSKNGITKKISAISGTNGSGIVIRDDNEVGLVMNSDYTTKQLLNDRSITDVGGVKILINTKASTTYVDTQDKSVIKSAFLTNLTHQGSSIYSGTTSFSLTGSNYLTDFPAIIMFNITTYVTLGANFTFIIDSLPPINIRSEGGDVINSLTGGNTYTAYKYHNEYRVLGIDTGSTGQDPALTTLLATGDMLLSNADKAKLDANTASFTAGLKTAYDAYNGDIANKVDKVAGKQLSTNDFTTVDKNKLDTISTAIVPDSTNKRYQTDVQNANNDATSGIQGQLDSKENTSNKSTLVVGNEASNVLFPTIKAMVDYYTAERVKNLAFSPLEDGNYWNINQFAGSGNVGIPFLSPGSLLGGTISTPNEARVIFQNSVSLNSSATLNSGYRYFTYQAISGANSYQNKRIELFFMLPSVESTNRLVRFGFKDGSVYPSNMSGGIYFQINNLTLTAKCTSSYATTTAVATYTLQKMQMYKMRISVNSDRTVVSFDLFLFGNATPVFSTVITTNLPNGASYVDTIEAYNTVAGVSALIYCYQFNHGTIQGQQKFG